MVSLELIVKTAQDVGFSLCGVAKSRPLSHMKTHFEQWQSDGCAQGLDYMNRNVERRFDPALLVNGSRTIIVCALNYKNPFWNQIESKPTHRVASYAYARDYHLTIKEMLHSMLATLQTHHPDLSGRCFTDTAPLLEKSWAAEAGVGWIGRNSLLVTPQYGSFVLLGEIVIDMEVDQYDPPFDGEHCGSCDRCVCSCPTGAIRQDRTIDSRLCISRHTIERPMEGYSVGDRELNGWLFGCDECQSCCPYNAKTPLYTHPLLKPIVSPLQATPTFWRSLRRNDFEQLFNQSPLSRVGYDTIHGRVTDMQDSES